MRLVAKEWLDLKLALWVSEHQREVAAALGDPSAAQTALRSLRSRSEALKEQTAGVELQLGKLASGWSTGLLDDIGYKIARDQAESDRARLRQEIERVSIELDATDLGTVDGWGTLFAQEDGAWNHAELGARVARVVREIRIHPDRIEIEPHVGRVTTTAKPDRRRGRRST